MSCADFYESLLLPMNIWFFLFTLMDLYRNFLYNFILSTFTLEFCMVYISCHAHSDFGCFLELYLLYEFLRLYTNFYMLLFFARTLWLLLLTENCSCEQGSWKKWATLYWVALEWVLTTSKLSKIQTLAPIPFLSNVRLDAFDHVTRLTMWERMVSQ